MKPWHVILALFVAFIVYVWAQTQLFKREARRRAQERLRDVFDNTDLDQTKPNQKGDSGHDN